MSILQFKMVDGMQNKDGTPHGIRPSANADRSRRGKHFQRQMQRRNCMNPSRCAPYSLRREYCASIGSLEIRLKA
jgi:hypothetical protein